MATLPEPEQLRAVEPPTEVAIALATTPGNVYTATATEAARIASVVYQLPNRERDE